MKFKEFINKYKPTKRRLMQLYFALLFNANVKGFISGQIYDNPNGSKFLCAPGINCYSCPGAIGACPLGSLQGSFDNGKSSVFYVCGILLLYAIMFGRMICGWLCPFGLIQDLLYKIKSPKLKKNPVTRILSFLKYAILVFFVLVVPITYAIRGIPTPAFCKYICPAGTIEGGLTLLSHKLNEGFMAMLGPLFTWKFMLMVSIVVSTVFIYRVFCRFICPLGGLYGLFNKISVFGVKVDEEKCTHCNLCVAQCKVDIKHVGDQECISCGECISVCPTQAISWKGPKILLKPNEVPADLPAEEKAVAQASREKKRLICRIATLVILAAALIGALIYGWKTSAPLPEQPTTPPVVNPSDGPQITVGYGEGQKLPGSLLPIITSSAITDDTLDPTATTGKITVINFWGTWCGPCVKELPDFDKIAEDYADTVVVYAVHTDMLKDSAPGFIQENYPNTKMTFLLDNATSDYYKATGGRGDYPRTIIIDENGIVVVNLSKAVHYEDLQKIIDEILAD